MGDPVVDALSITITTLQEKISSLEEEVNAYRASDLSKASSIWVVYSPIGFLHGVLNQIVHVKHAR